MNDVGFRGFDRDAMQFWHELAAEMSKPWFAANKQRYQSVWVAPMLALLHEVERGLSRAYAPLALADPGVLRIYRDLRFARDKTPYKTHIAGIIRIKGDAIAEAGNAALYLQLVPKGFASDHPRAELLRCRGFVCKFPAIPRGLLHEPELARWLLTHARTTAPLVIWLRRQLG